MWIFFFGTSPYFQVKMSPLEHVDDVTTQCGDSLCHVVTPWPQEASVLKNFFPCTRNSTAIMWLENVTGASVNARRKLVVVKRFSQDELPSWMCSEWLLMEIKQMC